MHRPTRLPRCSIAIVNAEGAIVPILDGGASVEPAGRLRSVYREYWTEEEDLVFVHRQPAADAAAPAVEHAGGIHGNFGYELLVREASQAATLRVNYFLVRPSLQGGKLSLEFEPKSVLVAGSLKGGQGLTIEVELQDGLSEERGRPPFKTLRVVCR